MTDVAKMETDLEVAQSTLDTIGVYLTRMGVPEARDGVPMHILFRARIGLGMEPYPDENAVKAPTTHADPLKPQDPTQPENAP